MHWQLGEVDMARRAGVVPFSLTAVNVESGQRSAAQRPGTHYHPPPDTAARHLTPPSPRSMYPRSQPMSAMPVGQAMRGEPVPTRPPMSGPGMPPSMASEHGEVYCMSGPGLAPIQSQGQPRNSGPLPSLAELTTGVSPYGTPVQRPRSGPLGPAAKHGVMMPAGQGYTTSEPTRSKRRASLEPMAREANVRRRIT